MNETYNRRQPVILTLMQWLPALFLFYLIVTKGFDFLYYVIDPTTRDLRQANNVAALAQIQARDQLETYALAALLGAVCFGVCGVVFIGLKWLYRQTNIVRPNLHGYPATWEGSAKIVAPTIPAQYGLPGQNPQALLPDLPTIARAYDAPLPAKALPLALRRDGQLITTPLLGSGATLVAGNSGGGKTELMASLIVTAARIWQQGQLPIEVMCLDPKGTDFYGLPRVPFMPYPVVSKPSECLDLLQTLAADAEKRKRELQNLGAKSLEHALELGLRIPVRLLLIDELSALTYQQSKGYREKFERALEGFCARGRAWGYKTVMASQYATADVITRRITGIKEDAVAFRTADAIASRVIIGEDGAETLPEIKGRLIYKRAAAITGQGLYADLKHEFTPFLQRLTTGLPAPQAPLLDLHTAPLPGPEPGDDTGAGAAVTAVPLTVSGVAVEPSGVGLQPAQSIAVESAGVARGKQGVPQDKPPDGPWEERFVWQAVQRCKGIKPAARELYPEVKAIYPGWDGGGKQFYWVRRAWAREQERRGFAVREQDLVIPPRYL